jgi:hypothetical protein
MSFGGFLERVTATVATARSSADCVQPCSMKIDGIPKCGPDTMT